MSKCFALSNRFDDSDADDGAGDGEGDGERDPDVLGDIGMEIISLVDLDISLKVSFLSNSHIVCRFGLLLGLESLQSMI